MSNTNKKPYAEACERNGAPILNVLKEKLQHLSSVLEIGSGTGQHAVMFSEAMPHIQWQTSDLEEQHAGIHLWIKEAALPNLLSPLLLDVSVKDQWPQQTYDAVFTANTAHIMPVEAVESMFALVSRCLKPDGLFIIYGPFMYGGEHTSESNWRFDRWIRAWEPHRGLRDVDWLKELAEKVGLFLVEDIEMPANNRVLIWSGNA